MGMVTLTVWGLVAKRVVVLMLAQLWFGQVPGNEAASGSMLVQEQPKPKVPKPEPKPRKLPEEPQLKRRRPPTPLVPPVTPAPPSPPRPRDSA